MDLQSLKKQRVAVVGLVSSGHQIVRELNRLGVDVSGFDSLGENQQKAVLKQVPKEGIRWFFSHEDEAKLLEHDLIITCPGAKKFGRALEKAKLKNIPLLTDADFVSQIVPPPIVGITGTNGKSSTLHFLKEILKGAQWDPQVFGGKGHPMPTFFGKKTPVTLFELSSYKLLYSQLFHPKIAIMTNFSMAHLERHPTLKEYYLAKCRIFARQTADDFLIYNGMQPLMLEFIKSEGARSQLVPFHYDGEIPEGVWKQGNNIFWRFRGENSQFTLKDFKPLGEHNKENLMAAIAAAKLLKVPDSAIAAAILKIDPLPMRLQPVAKVEGVTYYNDTRALGPAATSWALHTLKKNVLLIAGGTWIAGSNYAPFKDALKKHVKSLILYGENRQKYFQAWGDAAETLLVESLKEAVNLAYQKAGKGDAVLLSPGCLPELHIHPNPQRRGEEFEKCVEDLKGRQRTRRLLQWDLNKV